MLAGGSTNLAPVHNHAIRKHLNHARPLRQHLDVNRAISPHPGETIWTGRAPVVGYERSIKRACEHSGQKDGFFWGRADMRLSGKQRPRTVRLEAERANSDVRFWGYSGHSADPLRCLLLTQSGHPQGSAFLSANSTGLTARRAGQQFAPELSWSALEL